MPYLSKEIERLIARKQQHSLVRKQHSCGIFQEYDPGLDLKEIKSEGGPHQA